MLTLRESPALRANMPCAPTVMQLKGLQLTAHPIRQLRIKPVFSIFLSLSFPLLSLLGKSFSNFTVAKITDSMERLSGAVAAIIVPD